MPNKFIELTTVQDDRLISICVDEIMMILKNNDGASIWMRWMNPPMAVKESYDHVKVLIGDVC